MKHIVSAILLTCAAVPLAGAAGPAPGEKWKITSSMQMEGMSMPGSSSEVCKQPGDDAVPVKTEKNCEVYDVKRSGNVQSFKMRCTGKDAMEGAGEFTYLGKDHYKGKMQVKTGGESMTMAYEGQKLGSCDGGEMNLKAKELHAQAQQQIAESEKMQAQQCHDFAAEASSPGVMTTHCKDPADRKVFCSAVQTHDKFLPLARAEKSGNTGGRPLTESAQLCGFSVETQRAKLCSTAESQGKLNFIASQCPAEAETLAKMHCAGRKYTAISDKYRGFCSNFAQTSPEDEAVNETPAEQAKKGLMNKGKKALGGLFSR